MRTFFPARLSAASVAGPGAGRQTHALQGRRILVVEDEWLIAAQIGQILEGAGAVTVGPAHAVDEALELLNGDGHPDAALLDLNLRGQLVTPVARRLHDRTIPFVLLTAYVVDRLDEPMLQRAPRLGKPFAGSRLVTALAGLFASTS